MRKRIQSIIAAFILSVGFGVMMLAPTTYADDKKATPPSGTSSDAGCTDAKSCVTNGLQATGGTSSKTSISDIFKTIVNVLLFVIGAISVIMIIIGGIKYTTSNGDSSSVTSAKNTILYAVVGLLVSMFAYAIVNFVVTRFI